MGISTIVFSMSVVVVVLGLVGSDPDPLQDYCVADTKKGTRENFYCNGVPCINPKNVDTSHFATSALSKPGKIGIVLGFNVTLATIFNLPGMLGVLNGWIGLNLGGSKRTELIYV